MVGRYVFRSTRRRREPRNTITHYLHCTHRGIGFVKVDDLTRPYHRAEIEMIRHAIDRCGRPIVLSTSPGGETPIEEGGHVEQSCQHVASSMISGTIVERGCMFRFLRNGFPLWAPAIGRMGTCFLGRIGIRAERGDNRMSLFTRDEQYTLMSLFPDLPVAVDVRWESPG